MSEEITEPNPPAEPQLEIDEIKMQNFLQELKDNSNLFLALLGGLGAAGVGAGIWGLISATTGLQIGWMAVGIGFLVGLAVRAFGKGIDRVYGLIGGGLALLGCLAGNLLTVCILVAKEEAIPLFDLLGRVNVGIALELMQVSFSPMDLLFYGLAVYEGYRLSFRKISPEEMQLLAKT